MDSKAGEKIPRPLGETVHGTRPGEVLHFDCLYAGDSGPLGKDGLDEGDGVKYILVMMDDSSNFMWLEPTESCTVASTVKHLLRWCKTLGVPEVCMYVCMYVCMVIIYSRALIDRVRLPILLVVS